MLSLLDSMTYDLAGFAQRSGVFDDGLAANGFCIKFLDSKGSLLSLNAGGFRALELECFEDVAGRDWALLWPEAMRATVRHAVAEALDGRATRFDGQAPTARGNPRWWEVEVVPLPDPAPGGAQLIAVSYDITRFRQREIALETELSARQSLLSGLTRELRTETERLRLMESEASQSEKLRSLGSFVGSIVHDINNVLTVMQGAGRLLRRQGAGAVDPALVFEQMDLAVERGRKLVRQLLDFSRSEGNRPEVIDLGALLERDMDLMRQLTGPGNTLTVEAPPDLWRIHAEPARVSSVVFNLLANARDAIDASGAICITMANCPAEARPAGLRRADYVVLSVSDTGCGMTAEVVRRLGEPFFTTKPKGSGTGIGVGSAFELARRCRGTVEIDSAPGVGTTFRIYLARSELTGELVGTPNDRIETARHGRATVMVIAPGQEMRAGLEALLETLGYDVTAFGSAEAGRVALADGARFDLILCDEEDLPEQGAASRAALRAALPRARMICMTGTDSQVDEPGTVRVVKPVHERTLAARLLEALGRAPGQRQAPEILAGAIALAPTLGRDEMRRALGLWAEACGAGGRLPGLDMVERLRACAPGVAGLIALGQPGRDGLRRPSVTFAGADLLRRLGRPAPAPVAGLAEAPAPFLPGPQEEACLGPLAAAFRRCERGAAAADRPGPHSPERLFLPLSEDGESVTHLFALIVPERD